jgi:ornithine cyclodeaminase/alanine dehydrogenase-like protein (mu-crystallin family)
MPTFIADQDILAAVDVRRLIADMDRALTSGIKEKAEVPQRTSILREAPFGAFGALPAFSADVGLFTVKAATFVEDTGRPGGSVAAVVAAFSARTGELLAIVEGGSLTRVKCAAVSGVVTDRCAIDDARVLGILGSGVQASAQASGVSAVRDLTEIRVHSRNPRHAAEFRDRVDAETVPATRVTVVGSVEEAIRGCDIVSTATSSNRPLAASFPLVEHAHVNCMGSHTVEAREVPLEVLLSATVIVEDRATAVREAGEPHADALEVYELGGVAAESLKPRRTVFSSTGHALLDLITVAHILDALDVRIP